MKQTGYSKEDEYFHRKDQERIEKMRQAANEKRKEFEARHKDQPYWMRCPKCGSELKEEVLEHVIRIDTCGECGGQFFDRGEVDLLLRSKLRTATASAASSGSG